MDNGAFLKTVVTTEEGWFDLLIGPPDGSGWHDEWFWWPKDLNAILERADEASAISNIYFTPHLYEHKRSTTDNILGSRTLCVDLDDAILPTLNAPSLVVETSPSRHQGYWLLQEVQSPDVLSGMSRLLTYSIPEADRGCWQLGHKMRMPGTVNHKYASGPKLVKIVSATSQTYRDLKIPNARMIEAQVAAGDELWKPDVENLGGPRELWAKVRKNLPRKVASYFDRVQTDGEARSGALWALMLALFRAGCSRDEVFFLAWHSANNKFKDNKYHAELDLSKDILRAERHLKRAGQGEDIRSRIAEARRLPGTINEKRAYIAAIVRDALQQTGSFFTTDGGQDWYVREDLGKPIILTKHSDSLDSILEMRFGLNSTEIEQKYTVATLISTTRERGQKGITAALSYYDQDSNTLLVHGGRKEVYHIDENGIDVITNGDLGILFPWTAQGDQFDPDFRGAQSLDLLFEGCFDNLDDLQPGQALALLRAWMMFLLFRDGAVAKPILALLGQPGSGKSTLFRRIYTLLYGPSKAVNSITDPDDFDHAVSHDPLVVFDNVDTFVNWLPDRLAQSAASSDITKRKLYTDTDEIIVKRQALIGLTAHNPKFRREDIVDRLIMINFHRLAEHKPETEIVKRVIQLRDQLWGQYLLDAQKMLQSPIPSDEEIPKFRVADYARIGLWAARALGFEEDFVSALAVNTAEQIHFNLEEEDLLVDVLKRWASRPQTKEWYSSAEMWSGLSALTDDPFIFTRFYRNAVALGKKIFTLQETLRALFQIDYQIDDKGVRLWRIKPK